MTDPPTHSLTGVGDRDAATSKNWRELNNPLWSLHILHQKTSHNGILPTGNNRVGLKSWQGLYWAVLEQFGRFATFTRNFSREHCAYYASLNSAFRLVMILIWRWSHSRINIRSLRTFWDSFAPGYLGPHTSVLLQDVFWSRDIDLVVVNGRRG